MSSPEPASERRQSGRPASPRLDAGIARERRASRRAAAGTLPPSECDQRVCRVRPDLPAVDRAFDYRVPNEMAGAVRVGAIVRVPLHGRRVRGWVMADGVEPEAEVERLLPLLKVASAGPPADVVELCAWAAWRYAGPVTALLRAASPPNSVAPAAPAETGAALFPPNVVPDVVARARARSRAVVAWPPAADRRELVVGLLAEEGSTIVVVADARRLPVLLRQLEREGRRAVVLRADLAAAERTATWDRARAGACVVVGGRLAVLAPVPDLRAVVVLDEGDEALKEERAPAWNARELAFERARRAGARVTLVSPAPTLEAEEGAGPPLRPQRSAERSGWPRLEVVDPRDDPPGQGLFTTRLTAALQATLSEPGASAVCVLNRRGRARLLACNSCGELTRCEQCGAAVAESEDGLTCPRCSATRPRVCVHCHGTNLRARRAGVTRVREELAALLPRASIGEVDAATADVPDADVLVGTEAVLHRVPPGRRVRLCAFLEFDQELLATRYRAAEQALWLLVRAARLVGPRGGRGRLLTQTRLPGHEVIEGARQADPTVVALAERARRRALGFPPFGGLCEVTGAAPAVDLACVELRRQALRLLGPAPVASGARALVHAATVDALCNALAAADLTAARAHGRLRLEVDPLRV
jgi:primosomal protein N' (replication factor Y) (superfamily II helicase)